MTRDPTDNKEMAFSADSGPRIEVALVPPSSPYTSVVQEAAEEAGAFFVKMDAAIAAELAERVLVVDLTQAMVAPDLGHRVIAITDQEDLSCFDMVRPDEIFTRLPRSIRSLVAQERLRARVAQERQTLRYLNEIGMALSEISDRQELLDAILLHAREALKADGGTIYLRGKDDRIYFSAAQNDTIKFKPTRLSMPIDDHSVAGFVANTNDVLNIDDVYKVPVDSPYQPNLKFDEASGYRTRSMLLVPMTDRHQQVLGVLALVNRKPHFGVPIADFSRCLPFEDRHVELARSIASQASVALVNQNLLEELKALLESFIQMIASAIDAKSPYTGGHCARVPILTMMLAEAACEDDQGALAGFNLTEEEWYELKIAAWLHDCGKVTTPVHVMDKATKLETIWDRIHMLRVRFEVLERDAQIRKLVGSVEDEAGATARYEAEIESLRSDWEFLEKANIGSEFLSDEAKTRIHGIGERTYVEDGVERTLLSQEEVDSLCISRGTLTGDERLIINGHMVQTIEMLESLPFPRNLKRVPEYAGGHHEKMDGSGYPRGIFAGEMSVPARIMAIADVFEALTAQDRPYKKGKTLSESMEIMGKMKQFNHLDPDLFDLFVRSGVYQRYGERFLPKALLDAVEEEALLAIEPGPFELADEAVRRDRWEGFLPEYEPLRTSVMGALTEERSKD